jgi:hypothetical protein
VLGRSEHPHKISIQVKVVAAAASDKKDSVEGRVSESTVERKSDFFVNPEFHPPQPKEKPAVAATGPNTHPKKAVAAAEIGIAWGCLPAAWDWGPIGKITMHPFWAVRRMTEQQLRKAMADQASKMRVPPRFNCELVSHAITNVSVSVVNGNSVNITRILEVPFLTNTFELGEGEELILRVEDAKKPEAKKKKTWKDVLQEDDRNRKSQKLASGAK